jgi:putative acetyltransferase
MLIRPETAAAASAVRALYEAAFPTKSEAGLVELLRARSGWLSALLAEEGAQVVGHGGVVRVTLELDGGGAMPGAGLAPLAVLAPFRGRGIGGRLIEARIARCRADDVGFVVVLANPSKYLRLGFARASERGVRNEYGADAEFLLLELRPGAVPKTGALARFPPEFAEALG